jgi:SAM-dependent methyltransferase/RimJ/RimL family protein N-acetyltransferase
MMVMRGMSSGRELIASIRDVLLKEGLRGLGVRLLARTGYRRLVVMHLSLGASMPEATPGLLVVVELLRESDVEEYLRFRPRADSFEVRFRMASGARCFVARHQGRIVHAGWAAADKAWIDYLGCGMPLAEGDIYQFDSYTAPGFRGRGIARARVAAMARYLHREGYRRLVACVLPENANAVGPLEPLGYRAVGRIGVIRLGRWRVVRLRLKPDARVNPRGYWDEVLTETLATMPIEPWRAYMCRVYADLIARWLPPPNGGIGLKTDLFEEAITSHQLLSELGSGSVGLDCSLAIVAAARARLNASGVRHRFVVGDLRQVPLRSGCIGRVLAGSSLDHFADRGDIATGLAELARTLAPGGVLVLTLDNPHNPIVWLRNHLPFGWLNRLGLVPYYVGKTYRRREARERLEALGFRVTELTAVAHAPRAPAIWLASVAARPRGQWMAARLERLFWSFEVLGRWPTRYWSGYYLALRAEKRKPSA